MNADIYQRVTAQIVASLEQGQTTQWRIASRQLVPVSNVAIRCGAADVVDSDLVVLGSRRNACDGRFAGQRFRSLSSCVVNSR